MADNDTFLEDHENDSDLVRDLRKQLRARSAEVKELQTKVSSFEVQNRTSSIESYLKTKNLPQKVAKLIPADVEANEDALGAWVAEYGDVFGLKAEPAGETPSTETTTQTQAADPAAVAALAQAQAASHEGTSPLPVGLDAARSKLLEDAANAGSREELYARLQALQG